MRTIAYKCTCKTYKQINELLWLTKYLNQPQQMLHSYVLNMLPFKLFIYHILCHSSTRISTSFGNFHQASSCLWNLQNLSISHTLSTECLLLQQITKQQAVYMLSRSVLYDAEEYIVYPIAISVNIFFSITTWHLK